MKSYGKLPLAQSIMGLSILALNIRGQSIYRPPPWGPQTAVGHAPSHDMDVPLPISGSAMSGQTPLSLIPVNPWQERSGVSAT